MSRVFDVAEAGSGSLDRGIRERAAAVEAEVFYEVFDNTASQLSAEYDAYVKQTIFLAASSSNTVVGMMRLITPGKLLQKSLSDAQRSPFSVSLDRAFAAHEVDRESILDMATVAVVKQWRGRGVFDVLAQRAVDLARREQWSYFTAIVDDAVLAYLSNRGLSYAQLADSAGYLGSAQSAPVLFAVDCLEAIVEC